MEAIDFAIKVLNEALELDSRAINKIMQFKFECSEELAGHSTIQCGKTFQETFTISGLGLINGLFGVNENSEGMILACVEGGRITSFKRRGT